MGIEDIIKEVLLKNNLSINLETNNNYNLDIVKQIINRWDLEFRYEIDDVISEFDEKIRDLESLLERKEQDIDGLKDQIEELNN